MSFIQDDNDALKQKVIATLERTGLRSAVNAIYGKYPSKIGLDIDPAQSDKILSALRKDFSKVVYNSDEFEVVIGDGALVSDGFELPTKGERFVYSVSYGNINVEFDGSKYIVDGHILVSKEDLLKMLEETGGKLIKKVRDSVDVDVEDADDLWAVGFDIDGGFSQSNLVRAGSAAEAERKLTEAKKKRYPNSVIKVYGATKHTGSIKPGYPIIDSNEGFEDDDDELLVHDGHDTELKLLPVLEGVVRKWEAWKSKYKTLFELEDKYWRSWDGYRTSLQKEEPEKYKRLTDMLVKANHEVEPIIREWNRIAESVSRGRDGRSNFNVKLEPETFPASHLFRFNLRNIFNGIKQNVMTQRGDSAPVSDAKIEYVFNWRDTYHKTQQKTAILANNIGEAIRKFADYVALAGVGTANAYVMSISPNDGWVALYGTAHELKKKMGDSMPVADKLVEIPQAILNRIESIATSRGYKVAAKGKTLFGREHYEFVPLNPVTDIQMRAFVDEVDSYARSKNVPATFSANVVKVVFDFDKIYVNDSAVADKVSYDTLLANWGFAFIKGNGRTETWYYRDDDDEGFKRALRNIREVRPNLVASSTNDGTRQITIVKDSRKMFKVTDSSGKIYLVKANDELSALSRLADIKAVKDYSPEVRNFISKLEVIGLRFERDLGEDVIRFANPKKVSIDLIRKNIPSGSTVFERDGYVVVNF